MNFWWHLAIENIRKLKIETEFLETPCVNITIRKETESEYRQVEKLVREAFWNLYVPGCDEHYLVHIMRTHADYLPEMSFVAEVDGDIVGMIAYTRSHLMDEAGNQLKTLTFGPLCVHPKWQGKGVGPALVEHTRDLAIELGESAIAILGHPRNYVKFGFKNGIDFNVSDQEGNYPFGQLILPLKEDVFSGNKWRLHVSGVYSFSPDDALAFDKSFPEKEKKVMPSQEEFSIAVRAKL